MTRPRNIVGPQIRRLRVKRGLTQPMLAAKCNLLGWNLSREIVAKIESQVRWVADCELLCLAKSLGVPVTALLPVDKEISAVVRSFFRESRR